MRRVCGDTKKYLASNNIKNRPMRYFPGVHRVAPLLAIYGDMRYETDS